MKTVVVVITLDGMKVVKDKTFLVPRFWTASRILREFSTANNHVAVTSGPDRVKRNMFISSLPDEIIY